MSRNPAHLALPLLLTIGCALAAGPAAAAPRSQPPSASAGWLSRLVWPALLEPVQYGCQVDPNGSECRKRSIGTKNRADVNRYGCQLDPNGACLAKP